jgi:hypothetical protein
LLAAGAIAVSGKLEAYKMSKFINNLPIAVLVLLLGCSNTELASNHAVSSTDSSGATPVQVAQATKPDSLSDTTVIPGERVGPVTRKTTRQDLVKLFGEARLTDQDVAMGEGFTEPGTRVDLGSERSFSVVWSDASRTKAVAVRNFGTAWRTPQGIGVGTPFAQLQQKLGEFEFYGFAWDYGGTVVSSGTLLAQYKDMLILRLQTAPDAPQKSPEDFKAVVGERKFSSTNPHLRSLDIQVGEMIVQLAPSNP